jgi:ribosome-associated protein
MAKRAPRRPGGAAAASLAKALRAAETAEARRAEDVVVLDLRDQTLVTDYFVIATGTSRVQIRAVIDAIAEGLDDERPRGVREGDEAAGWVLLDYGDVVVHVFAPEARAFYRLERLWADAPTVAR